MDTLVRLSDDDNEAWERLFRAYMTFYEREEPQSMYDDTWARLLEDEQLHALGVKRDGHLVAFTHFLRHPSTTSPDFVYLSDLFTDPAARCGGIGRMLIEAVVDWARTEGCCRVYWTTQHFNHAARRLYDQLATTTDRVTYHLPIQSART